jgi:hypothetical protein
MNYQKIYTNLIRRGQQRVLEGYKETHHVIPKCIGGTDDETNLVELTPEEHYLCHLLLVKIYPNNIKLVKAAMFMVSSNQTQQRNNKAYGWLKRQYSEYMKGPNNPAKLNGVWNKGVKGYKNKVNFSEESKKMFSERMKIENPCARIKPWDHPRATEYSKSVWKNADKLYQVWLDNNKPSYCKLYTLVNNTCYTNESRVIGPYMNIVKYFRSGWVPTQDLEWTKL